MSAEVRLHVRPGREVEFQKVLRAWIKAVKDSGGAGRLPVLVVKDTLLVRVETILPGPSTNGSPSRAVPN